MFEQYTHTNLMLCDQPLFQWSTPPPNFFLFVATKKSSEETDGDMMRAILCQLEFNYSIKEYDHNGVSFRTHLHVPEIHPDTGRLFYEREDPGHVLKVHQNLFQGGERGLSPP